MIVSPCATAGVTADPGMAFAADLDRVVDRATEVAGRFRLTPGFRIYILGFSI